MTVTSGPGFSLMMEHIGLAAMLEANERTDTFETAIRYLMYHALALLAVAWLSEKVTSPWPTRAGCLRVMATPPAEASSAVVISSHLVPSLSRPWTRTASFMDTRRVLRCSTPFCMALRKASTDRLFFARRNRPERCPGPGGKGGMAAVFPEVAVVGLGLVGGSLARALTAVGYRVIGVDGESVRRAARRAGAVAATAAAVERVADADVVVLAAPPSVNRTLLRRLARVARPERLKAELRIPQTQARDVQVGQSGSRRSSDSLTSAAGSRVIPSGRP